MKKYELIALDMDGTLLDSKKNVLPSTKEALDKAEKQGKYLVFSTGRCLTELADYKEDLANLHYGILESGALLYDFEKNEILHKETLPSDYVEQIIETAKIEEPMFYYFKNGVSYLDKEQFLHMEKYHMGIYRDMFDTFAKKTDDICQSMLENKEHIEKLNLFHTSTESRQRTYERLKELPITLAFSEKTSLEISPLNVTKGSGLIRLCQYLGLSVDCTIAVGDADNDIDILNKCGFSVAMGNAAEHIKDICDAVVRDNDHDGIQDAIEQFLL